MTTGLPARRAGARAIRAQAATRARLAAALLAGALAGSPLAGCTDATASVTLIVAVVGADGQQTSALRSDGQDTVRIEIFARTGDATPWTGPAQVETTLGSLGAPSPARAVELALDAGGRAQVRFACQDPQGAIERAGLAFVTVSAGEASIMLTLSCLPPLAAAGIEVAVPGDALLADGASTFAATALGYDGEPLPPGWLVRFSVQEPYALGEAAARELEVPIAGAAGQAEVTLAPSLQPGTATVCAEANIGTGAMRASTTTASFAPIPLLQLALAALPGTIYSDADEFSEITATVSRGGERVEGQSVVFDLEPGSGWPLATFGAAGAVSAMIRTTRSTDATGRARCELRGFAQGSGVVTVSATVQDAQHGGQPVTARKDLRIARHPLLGSFAFLDAVPTRLGTAGSALPRTAVLRFEVRDEDQQPMEYVWVRFSRAPGSSPYSWIATEGGGVEFATEADGLAVVTLTAGAVPRPTVVVAEATDPWTGLVWTASSVPIQVTTGQPSWGYLDLACERDSATLAMGSSRTCLIATADRDGQQLPVPASAQALSESGTASIADTRDDHGRATLQITAGLPLPSDRRDLAGNLGTHNPTDMLVTTTVQ